MVVYEVNRVLHMGGAKKAVVGAVIKGPVNPGVWILVGFSRISSEIIISYAQNADFQR